MQQFLPGDPVPQSGAYEERDPRTRQTVRRLLIPHGDRFPDLRREGGFFTRIDAKRSAGPATPN